MAVSSSCRWLCRAHDKTHPMNDYSFIYYLLRHEIEKCVTNILCREIDGRMERTNTRLRRQSPNVKTYITALSFLCKKNIENPPPLLRTCSLVNVEIHNSNFHSFPEFDYDSSLDSRIVQLCDRSHFSFVRYQIVRTQQTPSTLRSEAGRRQEKKRRRKKS